MQTQTHNIYNAFILHILSLHKRYPEACERVIFLFVKGKYNMRHQPTRNYCDCCRNKGRLFMMFEWPQNGSLRCNLKGREPQIPHYIKKIYCALFCCLECYRVISFSPRITVRRTCGSIILNTCCTYAAMNGFHSPSRNSWIFIE